MMKNAISTNNGFTICARINKNNYFTYKLFYNIDESEYEYIDSIILDHYPLLKSNYLSTINNNVLELLEIV
jgi:hypothetical protein